MVHELWTVDKINSLTPGQLCQDDVILLVDSRDIQFDLDAIITCKTKDDFLVVCRFDVDPHASGLEELNKGDIIAVKNAMIKIASFGNFTGPNNADNFLCILETTKLIRLFDNESKNWISPQQLFPFLQF
uniref:Uncharacterized protein n=1 Tax=Panagrolaimus sp. JU765 TaxID=591449 RepID=A0AC34RAD5_9BILA